MTGASGSRPASGFLSEEWVEAFASNVRAVAARHIWADANETLKLAVRVSGVPWAEGGEFAYTIVLAGGAEVVVGTDEGADVVLVGPYEAARALAEGSRGVSELLEAGAIRVRGDVAKLLRANELLSSLASGRCPDAPSDGHDTVS